MLTNIAMQKKRIKSSGIVHTYIKQCLITGKKKCSWKYFYPFISEWFTWFLCFRYLHPPNEMRCPLPPHIKKAGKIISLHFLFIFFCNYFTVSSWLSFSIIITYSCKYNYTSEFTCCAFQWNIDGICRILSLNHRMG